MEKNNHYILGFERRTSGAFEHAWNLGKNLNENNMNTKYFSHWWNSPTKEISFLDESSRPIDSNDIGKLNGIFHLQTHTWEYEKHLDKIAKNPDSKLIYNMHAIIPYFYLNENHKTSFLNGTLPDKIFKDVIENRMDDRMRAQLTAIEKSDYIFAISEGHKKVLEMMNVEKPIHVFENVSDFDSISKESLNKSQKNGMILRDSLEAENVLVYCGNLYEKKGSFGLFDSFNKIKENYGSSKLILLGSGQDKVENLLSVGLKKSDLENIVLVPWINKNTTKGKEEFLKYYYASDALIQPMITDGLFSKTVIDAMGIELPTITCKSPYTIGTSKNSNEIFNSFAQIKEDPLETNRIVKLAKEKVNRENTWKSYIKRLDKIGK